MAFRADEQRALLLERNIERLITKDIKLSKEGGEASKQALLELICEENLGNPIETYPTWHPLVRTESHRDCIVPNDECGYKGLDHTIYFSNGFITCPYRDSGKADEVIESSLARERYPIAHVTARKLDIPLYHTTAQPVLVKCEWMKPLSEDGTIPLSIALPLMLENEVPCWRWSQFGEDWKSMRSNFLGSPHGARSSLFVNQDTGQGLKRIWTNLVESRMFGPIK